MPNRCVPVGCQSGYTEKKSEIAGACEGSSSQELNLKENVPSFQFPREETHSKLRKEWVKFVNRPSSNWKPSKSSVICMKHFEERLIIYGKRKKTLNMNLNPVPSIHSEEVCKRPSTIPTPVIHRKLPKKEICQSMKCKILRRMIPYLVLWNLMKNIHLLDFNLEKQMIVFCITICSLMKKRHFPRFLDVLGWIKNSMFSYNLVEIHYLYLIGLYVEQMQNCQDLEC